MTNDGGPAFPVPDERDPVTRAGIVEGSVGMSLRDEVDLQLDGMRLCGVPAERIKREDEP